jgi:hypothetical protein
MFDFTFCTHFLLEHNCYISQGILVLFLCSMHLLMQVMCLLICLIKSWHMNIFSVLRVFTIGFLKDINFYTVILPVGNVL